MIVGMVLGLGASAPLWADGAPSVASPAVVSSGGDEQKPDEKAKPAEEKKDGDAEMKSDINFRLREIDFGVEKADADSFSSKFREYRPLPNGPVVTYVHFAGDQKYRYDLVATDVLQQNQRYDGWFEAGPIDLFGEWREIPHSLGNNGHTLFTQTAPGVWSMSPALQASFQQTLAQQYAINPDNVNYTFLNNMLAPSFATANAVNLAILRKQGTIEAKLTNDKPVDVRVRYTDENRYGSQAAGTSFGFSSAIETASPVDYHTQDFAVTAEWDQPWGLIRGGFDFNQFTNRVPTETWPNPFLTQDSITGTGLQVGPATGRISLPPDNQSVTGSLGFLYRFGGNTRFTADASFSDWTQNAAFMPFTTNTALTVPDQNLPSSLNGKINVFSLNTGLTSQPIPHLNITAQYRYYDLSNDTPIINLTSGFVSFDSSFSASPTSSTSFGYSTNDGNLAVAYDFGPLTLEGGYKFLGYNRTDRETGTTSQNTGYGEVSLHEWQWLVLRALYEKGSRSYDYYISADGFLPETRMFDQAALDTERYGVQAQASPGDGKLTFSLDFWKQNDDYNQTTEGLLYDHNWTIDVGAEFQASDQMSIYAYYGHEDGETFQRARQSGSSFSTNPLDDWTSQITTPVDTFGGGVTYRFPKDKGAFKLWGYYQFVNSSNNIAASPMGATGGGASLPYYDATKLYNISAELSFKLSQRWKLAFGGFYESYTIRDLQTGDQTDGYVLTNYLPSTIFLAANSGDYNGHQIYVHASYTW
jgi:MtrB/PioB family decaheme-associated outer membrane protein